MIVDITRDNDLGEYNLFLRDLSVLIKSPDLFKCLVLLNEYLVNNGYEELLKDESLMYTMDSYTMVAMISSNVNLLKRLSQAPSKFLQSQEKFGISSQSGSTKPFSSTKKKVDSLTSEWDKMSRSFNKRQKYEKGFKK